MTHSMSHSKRRPGRDSIQAMKTKIITGVTLFIRDLLRHDYFTAGWIWCLLVQGRAGMDNDRSGIASLTSDDLPDGVFTP